MIKTSINLKKRIYSFIGKLFDLAPLLLFFVLFSGGFGLKNAFLGLLLFYFLYAIVALIRHRDFFMMQLRYIETRIYGKPLDRDNWQDDELKHTKVKITK